MSDPQASNVIVTPLKGPAPGIIKGVEPMKGMIWAKKKSDGKLINIPADWFDPELYERTSAPKTTAPRAKLEEEPVPTPDEMAKMSFATIKQQAALEGADISGVTTKEAAIAAIVKAR